MWQRLIRVNAGGRVFQTSLGTLMQYPNTKFANLFSPLVSGTPSPAAAALSSSSFVSCAGPSHPHSRNEELHDSKRPECKAMLPPTSVVGDTSVTPKETTAPSPPSTNFSSGFLQPPEGETPEIFLDVCPRVFERVLNFLRTHRIALPGSEDLPLRGDLVHQLHEWDLLRFAFPSSSSQQEGEKEAEGHHRSNNGPTANSEGEEGEGELQRHLTPMPDVCVVQLLDTMSLEAGIRRHALTVTYGADGFLLRPLTQRIRRDLHPQLSSTYWQVHQTGERSLFFATTRVADGAAALLTTSIQQQVMEHTESLGYTLIQSQMTISPDPVHVSVRLLLQQMIFRRARLSGMEARDVEEMLALEHDGEEDEPEEETFVNLEPRHVGPQKTYHTGELFPPEEDLSTPFFESNRPLSKSLS